MHHAVARDEDGDVVRSVGAANRAGTLGIAERRGEEMNQRLFVLAIISAVFLPLGFLTGLFGVNVGGMPGVDSSVAFTLLSLAMAGCAVGLLALFKRIGWM